MKLFRADFVEMMVLSPLILTGNEAGDVPWYVGFTLGLYDIRFAKIAYSTDVKLTLVEFMAIHPSIHTLKVSLSQHEIAQSITHPGPSPSFHESILMKNKFQPFSGRKPARSINEGVQQ